MCGFYTDFTLTFRFQTNTYQAIVISDGKETYSIFTYNCDRLVWDGRVGASLASIGYNVLSTVEADVRNFENHGLSRTADVGLLACNHTRLNRPWTNVVYRIGVAVNTEQLERSRCLARQAQDEALYPLSTEDLFQAQFFLNDCPCSVFQANRDRRFRFFSFDRPTVCFTNRFLAFYGDLLIINRCCYDLRYIIAAVTTLTNEYSY